MSLPVAILAGGLATRLRPITKKIPKALLEINGEPFLAHQLRLLQAAGISQIVICAWYYGEMIREFAGDGHTFGMEIEYSFDGDQPLGTGGAIQKALPLLGPAFYVLYGDSYLLCDYHLVEDAFFKSEKDGLMTIFHNRDQGDSSNVLYKNSCILNYNKYNRTPEMEHIDYGLGILRASAFSPYSTGQPIDLARIYMDLIERNQLAGFEVYQPFYEVGSFAGIKALEEYLKGKQLSLIE